MYKIFFNKYDKTLIKLLNIKKYSSVCIIYDYNTEIFIQNIENIPLIQNKILKIKFPEGESNKNIYNIYKIWKQLIKYNIDSNSLIINIGGGVVTDAGGFIASTYKRGVDFINIPTTLLCMVDACLGGKNGFNINNIKNVIGTFNHPKYIIIDPDLLKNLDKKNMMSGLGEMIKHGLINNKLHWEKIIKLKDFNLKSLKPIIKESIKIKQKIIEIDFKDTNIRKILNMGHSIGHAIESIYINIISHGHAIVIGICIECIISNNKKLLNLNDLKEILDNIIRIFNLKEINLKDVSKIIDIIKNDKKNMNTKIYMSLLKSIGTCSYNIECTELEIKNAIIYYNKYINNYYTRLVN